MLSVLLRINDFRLDDVEMLKRGGFHSIIPSKPTIAERIANLSLQT